jgi:hypothetical protein
MSRMSRTSRSRSVCRRLLVWSLWSLVLGAALVAFSVACGPPPDGWPGAGRSFTPPPVSTGQGGADTGPEPAADTSPPPAPKDTGTDAKD